jgi:hypothetical protein
MRIALRADCRALEPCGGGGHAARGAHPPVVAGWAPEDYAISIDHTGSLEDGHRI